jgi:hypothetical protein
LNLIASSSSTLLLSSFAVILSVSEGSFPRGEILRYAQDDSEARDDSKARCQ